MIACATESPALSLDALGVTAAVGDPGWLLATPLESRSFSEGIVLDGGIDHEAEAKKDFDSELS